jgi:hypothetical protein
LVFGLCVTDVERILRLAWYSIDGGWDHKLLAYFLPSGAKVLTTSEGIVFSELLIDA